MRPVSFKVLKNDVSNHVNKFRSLPQSVCLSVNAAHVCTTWKKELRFLYSYPLYGIVPLCSKRYLRQFLSKFRYGTKLAKFLFLLSFNVEYTCSIMMLFTFTIVQRLATALPKEDERLVLHWEKFATSLEKSNRLSLSD